MRDCVCVSSDCAAFTLIGHNHDANGLFIGAPCWGDRPEAGGRVGYCRGATIVADFWNLAGAKGPGRAAYPPEGVGVTHRHLLGVLACIAVPISAGGTSKLHALGGGGQSSTTSN